MMDLYQHVCYYCRPRMPVFLMMFCLCVHVFHHSSKEDVEKCKQKDLLEQTMSEMIGEFPALHRTIVAERDIYLTHTLRQAARCVEAPPNNQSEYDWQAHTWLNL